MDARELRHMNGSKSVIFSLHQIKRKLEHKNVFRVLQQKQNLWLKKWKKYVIEITRRHRTLITAYRKTSQMEKIQWGINIIG